MKKKKATPTPNTHWSFLYWSGLILGIGAISSTLLPSEPSVKPTPESKRVATKSWRQPRGLDVKPEKANPPPSRGGSEAHKNTFVDLARCEAVDTSSREAEPSQDLEPLQARIRQAKNKDGQLEVWTDRIHSDQFLAWETQDSTGDWHSTFDIIPSKNFSLWALQRDSNGQIIREIQVLKNGRGRIVNRSQEPGSLKRATRTLMKFEGCRFLSPPAQV